MTVCAHRPGGGTGYHAPNALFVEPDSHHAAIAVFPLRLIRSSPSPATTPPQARTVQASGGSI